MVEAADTDELLSLIEDSADAFLAERHRRDALRHTPVPSLWAGLADLGLLGLNLPESDGGSGLGAAGVVGIARLFGRSLLPDPFVAHAVIPACLIAGLPDGPRRASLAATLLEGSRSITLAWQEKAGIPATDLIAAQGVSTGLKGLKIAVPYAEIILVTAIQDDQPVIVEGHAQPAPEGSRTLAGGAFGELDLSTLNVVSAPLLTGASALNAVNRAVTLGTLAAAAQLCGIAEGAFSLTLEHLKTRRQFGQTIGAFQALQHRAVDMKMALALSEASIVEAARSWDKDPNAKATAAAVSAAKARAGATAELVSREAIQLHGAMGFTEEADVGLFVRAAQSLNPWLGSPREHRRRFVAHEAPHA